MLTSASNKDISNTAPSVYLQKVAAAAGDDLPLWLASNLISQEAYDAALQDDYDAFLVARAKAIHDEISPKAGWADDAVAAPG